MKEILLAMGNLPAHAPTYTLEHTASIPDSMVYLGTGSFALLDNQTKLVYVDSATRVLVFDYPNVTDGYTVYESGSTGGSVLNLAVLSDSEIAFVGSSSSTTRYTQRYVKFDAITSTFTTLASRVSYSGGLNLGYHDGSFYNSRADYVVNGTTTTYFYKGVSGGDLLFSLPGYNPTFMVLADSLFTTAGYWDIHANQFRTTSKLNSFYTLRTLMTLGNQTYWISISSNGWINIYLTNPLANFARGSSVVSMQLPKTEMDSSFAYPGIWSVSNNSGIVTCQEYLPSKRTRATHIFEFKIT